MADLGFLGPYAALAQLGAVLVITALFIWQVTCQFPRMIADQRADAKAAQSAVDAANDKSVRFVSACIDDFRAELAAERDWRERNIGGLHDRLDRLECQRVAAAAPRPPLPHA